VLVLVLAQPPRAHVAPAAGLRSIYLGDQLYRRFGKPRSDANYVYKAVVFEVVLIWERTRIAVRAYSNMLFLDLTITVGRTTRRQAARTGMTKGHLRRGLCGPNGTETLWAPKSG